MRISTDREILRAGAHSSADIALTLIKHQPSFSLRAHDLNLTRLTVTTLPGFKTSTI